MTFLGLQKLTMTRTKDIALCAVKKFLSPMEGKLMLFITVSAAAIRRQNRLQVPKQLALSSLELNQDLRSISRYVAFIIC